MSHSHDEFRESAPAYALGILDADERRAFEEHLTHCSECSAEVRSLTLTIDALARSVPQRTPPPGLRERVMTSLSEPSLSEADWTNLIEGDAMTRRSARPRWAWMPVAASVLIALGAGIYGSHLHVEGRLNALSQRAEATDRDVATARRAAVDARSAMKILAAPDVLKIDLQGADVAANAAARALWSRQHGLVFTGLNMPVPPAGRCYQVWVLTAGAAISVGILPEGGGDFAVLETPPDITQPLGVAVTVEPVGGGAKPSGATVLVGKQPLPF